MLRSVHVEPRSAAFHLNLVLGPDSGLKVDVRLVLFRRLLPRSGEVEIRVRTVLGGVIPPDLIVGSAIGWSEIDVLVASIALEPKRDAYESARATAGTGGRCIPPHIPIGGVFVKPPANECEVFMGSATVIADGDPLTRLGLPALSCHCIGMPPIPRLKKKRKTKSLVLPTSVVLAVPAGAPVLVGGPPTISMMALGMRAAMAGLGKAFKKLRKLQTTASVLHTTAHPDDENNALLVMLNRGQGYRTALATATRGNGGQNEIGPEIFEALGVLRTEELAAMQASAG